jgi:hypothetical protein
MRFAGIPNVDMQIVKGKMILSGLLILLLMAWLQSMSLGNGYRAICMWAIESSLKGYHLYFDGRAMADLYGFYYEWQPILALLNKEFPDIAQLRKSQLEALWTLSNKGVRNG